MCWCCLIYNDISSITTLCPYPGIAIIIISLLAIRSLGDSAILQSNLKYDEAISCYKKAIDLYEEGSQKSYKAIGELGRTLTYKGNYKEGLKKIKEGFGSILFDHKQSKMHIYST